MFWNELIKQIKTIGWNIELDELSKFYHAKGKKLCQITQTRIKAHKPST